MQVLKECNQSVLPLEKLFVLKFYTTFLRNITFSLSLTQVHIKTLIIEATDAFRLVTFSLVCSYYIVFLYLHLIQATSKQKKWQIWGDNDSYQMPDNFIKLMTNAAFMGTLTTTTNYLTTSLDYGDCSDSSCLHWSRFVHSQNITLRPF